MRRHSRISKQLTEEQGVDTVGKRKSAASRILRCVSVGERTDGGSKVLERRKSLVRLSSWGRSGGLSPSNVSKLRPSSANAWQCGPREKGRSLLEQSCKAFPA
jgi:hypothetical protein